MSLASEFYAAVNMFSIKIPYPRAGSSINTCVTAPTSRPSCKIGLPDMGDVKYGQHIIFQNFY